MRPARDGDVGHAVVEQVLGSKFGVDVDEYAVGSLALAGMTRDGIAVVQMRMPGRIDLDRAAVVHLEHHPALADSLHGPKLAVGQLQLG